MSQFNTLVGLVTVSFWLHIALMALLNLMQAWLLINIGDGAWIYFCERYFISEHKETL